MGAMIAFAAAALMLWTSALAGAEQHAPALTAADYDRFMRAPVDVRHERFDRLDPEHKSWLKREHARRWLAKNRDRLNAKQTAAVTAAIEYLSPELYRTPYDPESRKAENTIKRNLECSLGRDNVVAAFTFLPPEPGSTWRDWADEWLTWFKECPGR